MKERGGLDLPSFVSACPLTVIVNRLLNDDTKLEKFWYSSGKKCYT